MCADKRARLNGRGLDALFDTSKRQDASKPASQNADDPKIKETYYLSADCAAGLEDLRLLLRREYGLRPRDASKSVIVEAAILNAIRAPHDVADTLRKIVDR